MIRLKKFTIQLRKNETCVAINSERYFGIDFPPPKLRDLLIIASSMARHKPFLPALIFGLWCISIVRFGSFLRPNKAISGSVHVYSSGKRNITSFWVERPAKKIAVQKSLFGKDSELRAKLEVDGARIFASKLGNNLVSELTDCSVVKMNYLPMRRMVLPEEVLNETFDKREIQDVVEFSQLLPFYSREVPSDILVGIQPILSEYSQIKVPCSFCHGDLNPSNICINGGKLQIIDFENFTESAPMLLDSLRYRYSVSRFMNQLGPKELLSFFWDRPRFHCEESPVFLLLILEEIGRRVREDLDYSYELNMLMVFVKK